MVDSTKWAQLGSDVKGDIYKGLLERNAEDTKSGAGQYFTPRARISAMVQCVRPAPGQTIADPACGVIPPFSMGLGRRIHAAVFSFIAGVMPPMPMLGLSLL
ncbi:N-6 DNA methylase [Octadecabacter antarcticus]|uniref:N-6 DNA methylase n=1 Tax=Octadecabacter antarcticus TaxID=1217908 RepID=UPI0005C44A84